MTCSFFNQIAKDPPSFKSAKDLRNRIESLPAGPRWWSTEIKLNGYTTEDPVILYWRDGLEVIEHLFSNPIFANSLEMTPYQLHDADDMRHYSEFMSAEEAWKYQVCISKYLSLSSVLKPSV